MKSEGLWDNGHWWFKLTHVCRRWRDLILGSASYLGLRLVCTNGTPVGDLLAHFLPLPLAIDYYCLDGYFVEDEEEIILALEQRERVRCIRLVIPVLNMRKLITAIDEEYPTLEHLILWPLSEDYSSLILPKTLQAPHLRHLTLCAIDLPIESRLLITAVGLTTLNMIRPPYLQPAVLIQWLSFLPQLENMTSLSLPVSNRDVDRQPTGIQTPITTHITLPNLRSFEVWGDSAYSEVLFRCITTPRLKRLEIGFFEQLTFSVSRLQQFMDTIENFRFDRVDFMFFDEGVFVEFHPLKAKTVSFSINVKCCHLDWQVSSVAQIFNALSQTFSTVEHLSLGHEIHTHSSEEHNEVDRAEWRKLLGSFRNVKTLLIGDGLVEELSRCQILDDGEDSLEVLPELQELRYLRDVLRFTPRP